MTEPSCTVEVVYALPDVQHTVQVQWQDGLTAFGAVSASGLLTHVGNIEAANLVLGVFGRHVQHAYKIEAGDRVEICRPLQQDPRELRKTMTSEGRFVGRRDD